MDKKEYIERAAVKDEILSWAVCINHPELLSKEDTMYCIDNMPAADVEEVVRCKDCIWRGREECAMFYRCDCGEQHTWETDNDFCSYGERRDENA